MFRPQFYHVYRFSLSFSFDALPRDIFDIMKINQVQVRLFIFLRLEISFPSKKYCMKIFREAFLMSSRDVFAHFN